MNPKFIIVFLIFSTTVFAQTSNQIQDLFIAEKVYLQLSSRNSTAGQTIWYKAIVTDSKYHLPSDSGVLYVDLIDPFGNLIEHQLLKLTKGIGNGAINLKDDYVNGLYLIRAYTRWNLNFGDAFLYQSEITIYDDYVKDRLDVFKDLKIEEQDSTNHNLVGIINPKSIGYSDELKLHIEWTKKSDSISIKKGAIGAFKLNYKIVENPNWINLRLKNEQHISSLKTLVLNNTLLDVQFFPESGKLIAGLPNKIGFKAVGFDSRGEKIQGIVYDDSGNPITEFASNHLGMGYFTMVPSVNTTYSARVSSYKNPNYISLKRMPNVNNHGSIISITRNTDKINVEILSNKQDEYIYVKVKSREDDYYLIEGPLRNGQLKAEIPAKGLPNGIVVFKLLNSKKEPIAERLFFNNNLENKLAINVETLKAEYNKREKTKLEIMVNEGPRPSINTSMSIFVLNKNLWLNENDNINSFFYLSSELRGKIEEPGHYFNSMSDRFNDLEALLLTQGWRNYKYPVQRDFNKFYRLEKALSVSGHVISNNIKRNVGQSSITLTTFGKETTIYPQTTDSLGRFKFNLKDHYGNRQRILLSAANELRPKAKLSLILDTLKIPKIKYQVTPQKDVLNPIAKKVISEKIRKDKSRIIFDSLIGVTQLNEVIVKDVFLNPKRENIYKKFGEPDFVIKGENLRKQEKKWSSGLFSILLFNYAEHIRIEKFSDGFMLAHINAGSKEPTLVAVDGRLLQVFEYENVPYMPSEIIEDIELIKYAKSFKHKYLQVFPDTNPLKAPSIGHIISIYTKGGVGVQGSNKSIAGTLSSSIDVFTPKKEFYTPKYDKSKLIENQRPDLRSLVHWQPHIKTDKFGKANSEFFNNDVSGDYIVIIEAISENGKIGYQEFEFSVLE